jgi:conjugative coupling factor TraD, TOL family
MAGEQHVLSTKLRPPVELYTATICACAVFLSLKAPWVLSLTPQLGIAFAILFGIFGAVRAKQGFDVVRYQHNLRRLSRFAMTSKEIPVSNKFLWLGRGFKWGRIHTQRMTDALDPKVAEYVEPSALYRAARSFERWAEGVSVLMPLSRLTSLDSPFNPVRPLPDVGGSPLLHGVETDEKDVFLPLSERVGHTLVLGTTRVGKTRLCEVYVTQDIHRGDVTIVFDPKGDADLLLRTYTEAKRAGRDKEFYVFHLGYPDLSSRYNAIGRFSRLTEIPTRVAGQLSGDGNSAAFKQFAWRFVNIISRALVALGHRPDYTLISRYVVNIDNLFVEYAKKLLNDNASKYPKAWDQIIEIANRVNDKNVPINMRGRDREVVAIEQYISQMKIYDDVMDGLRSAVRYDRTYFDKIVASLLPLLEKLTTGKTAQLLAPNYTDINDTRPIFDWMQVIRKRGIVYVGLDALADADVAAAVGNSMFADLVSVAGHIYKFGVDGDVPGAQADKKVPINIHADEFNELMGDEFIPMVNKGGGAGYQVTAYTQTLSDVEARTGNRAKAGQVVGNFNTLQMLRVRETLSAKLLTDQLPKVQILQRTLVSGASDSADPTAATDFTSSNQDRISATQVAMIEPAHIVKLPKGQMYSLQQGGELWKVRMPLPKFDANDEIPENVAELADIMRKNYNPNAGNWWETTSGMATSMAMFSQMSDPMLGRVDTEVMTDDEMNGVFSDEENGDYGAEEEEETNEQSTTDDEDFE